jgi:hypothetical protein
MAEIGLSLFFTLQLLDGKKEVGAPQYIGPKMIWQHGHRSFCFALGRVSVDGTDKVCSVFWFQGEDGNLRAVERSDWSTIGYLSGGTSCSEYSDFSSEIKPMKVQKAPYAWHYNNLDGVKCKLWTVPQKGLPGLLHKQTSHTSVQIANVIKLTLALILAVVSFDSARKAAFAMACMSDALAKEAHHEIRMDETSNQIASVQGSYTIIFNCDGRPPSTVYTSDLPSSFACVPGPASLAPKVTP